jgi:hypothetical protein
MNFNISWFFVLIAFGIMCWCAYKTPPGVGRMTLVSWAFFFLSILVQGIITMHASGSAH